MLNTKSSILEPVSNGAENLIKIGKKYIATVKITGTAHLLMHCWNNEAVDESAKALKNSAKKKTDDLESYVIRNKDGQIVVPTVNFCASIRTAGKEFQSPTSPRKSMHDLLKASVVPFEEFGVVNDGKATWEFVDCRRVVIQRAGITRRRPAFFEGWTIEFKVQVLQPEYVSPSKLHDIISHAGQFCAIGDFRPTYGRFRIDSFNVSPI